MSPDVIGFGLMCFAFGMMTSTLIHAHYRDKRARAASSAERWALRLGMPPDDLLALVNECRDRGPDIDQLGHCLMKMQQHLARANAPDWPPDVISQFRKVATLAAVLEPVVRAAYVTEVFGRGGIELLQLKRFAPAFIPEAAEYPVANARK
jgi:hypothetical protein